MSTKVGLTINLYAVLLILSLFLVFLEENFSIILIILLFTLLASTTSDLVLESIRFNILHLVYKFKYLYTALYGVLYLNFLLSKPFLVFDRWVLSPIVWKSLKTSFSFSSNEGVVSCLLLLLYSSRSVKYFRRTTIGSLNLLFNKMSSTSSRMNYIVYLILISR